MRVLFLAAEAAPLVKVGGLGDVAGELPPALRRLGVELRLMLPFHRSIDRDALPLELIAEFEIDRNLLGLPAKVWRTNLTHGPVELLDGEPIRRAQGVYGDHEHELEKFLFSSMAALRACEAQAWKPDILHAHDWHAAFAVIWLASQRAGNAFWSRTRTLLTIHNLGYHGDESSSMLDAYGLSPPSSEAMPAWARNRPLAMGLAAADWISTVSQTYAREILEPAYGHGLEGLLRIRNDRLVGILNGIDQNIWDPSQDEALPDRFSMDTLDRRRAMKSALQEELGLPVDPQVPLMAMVTRMDHQKGVDLAFEALDGLHSKPWQFVVLGSGDVNLEALAREFGQRHPGNSRMILRFDPPLARRIYAGADMILLPSRYEPSGLAQMIGMRYGCVPVARATGGLKDTVIDETSGDSANGFLFGLAHADSLRAALERAFVAHANSSRWRALQETGMSQDFGWSRPAQRYYELYRTVASTLDHAA